MTAVIARAGAKTYDHSIHPRPDSHRVDLFNLGALAFLDVDDHIDLVAGQLRDFGVDSNHVLALAEILIDEIPLHFVEHRSVEDLTGGPFAVSKKIAQTA